MEKGRMGYKWRWVYSSVFEIMCLGGLIITVGGGWLFWRAAVAPYQPHCRHGGQRLDGRYRSYGESH